MSDKIKSSANVDQLLGIKDPTTRHKQIKRWLAVAIVLLLFFIAYKILVPEQDPDMAAYAQRIIQFVDGRVETDILNGAREVRP